MRAWIAIVALWAVQCAPPSSDDAGADAALGADDAGDAFVTAPHHPLPTLRTEGGPTLAHPILVGITFASDPNGFALGDFASWLPNSTWLAAVGREYGIASGALDMNIVLQSPPPASLDAVDVPAWLADRVREGDAPVAPADQPSYLYVIFLPSTTALTVGAMQSCIEFYGFHGEATIGERTAPYAIAASCPPLDGVTTLERSEITASHEIIEAATDPYLVTAPALRLASDDDTAWQLFGGEVADLCPNQLVSVRGHLLQRVYSNAAAAAGLDPCVPSDASMPYFNVSVDPPTTQSAFPGTTLWYTVTGWSTAAMNDWSIRVVAAPGAQPLETHLLGRTLNNGRSVRLRVDLPDWLPDGATAGLAIESTSSDGTVHQMPLRVRVW